MSRKVLLYVSLSGLVLVCGTVASLPLVGGQTAVPDPLTKYGEIHTKPMKVVDEQDPKFALDLLEKFVGAGKDERQVCHRLAHAIGGSAYGKYQDFQMAMSFERPICGSGYMHGVTEAYIRTLGSIAVEERTRVLAEVCAKYTSGKYTNKQCYHGVGHGLMLYLSNDLPQALRVCESLKDSSARTSCAQGVFMENFDSDQEDHPSPYVKAGDPFFACDLQEDQPIKESCYLWSSLQYFQSHPFEYAGGLKWCVSAGDFASNCALGVGLSAAINEPDIKFLEQLCTNAPSGLSHACLSGVVGSLARESGSYASAYESCALFSEDNSSLCRDLITSQATQFER